MCVLNEYRYELKADELKEDPQNICLRPDLRCAVCIRIGSYGNQQKKKNHSIKWYLASLTCEHKIKLEEQSHLVLRNSFRLIVRLSRSGFSLFPVIITSTLQERLSSSFLTVVIFLSWAQGLALMLGDEALHPKGVFLYQSWCTMSCLYMVRLPC